MSELLQLGGAQTGPTRYTSNNTLKETCIIQNGTGCSNFEFSNDMHTIVDEVSYCNMKEVTEF